MKKAIICIFPFLNVLLFFSNIGDKSRLESSTRLDSNLEQDSLTLKQKTDYGKIPVSFIPNVGQFNRQVKYCAKIGKYTLWLAEKGIVFDGIYPRDSQDERDNKEETKIHPMFKRLFSYVPRLYRRDVSRLVFLSSDRGKWLANVCAYGGIVYHL